MHDWMERFRRTVLEIFGARVVCIGLQGSRGRGEAAERTVRIGACSLYHGCAHNMLLSKAAKCWPRF